MIASLALKLSIYLECGVPQFLPYCTYPMLAETEVNNYVTFKFLFLLTRF